jgi:(E)-4-hydroxy-3-methylbut-2-enyl-diphosphate synthase
MTGSYSYCNSLTSYSRFRTRVVQVGDIPLGGEHPIRVQSMTSTPTLDTIATVEQAIKLADAGCEYVRIATQGIREAESLSTIKKSLRTRGCHVPLIADVHFNPKVAEIAARYVEKVRINPGNFADKRIGKARFTAAEYLQGLDGIRQRLLPLLSICKENGTVLRIGSNHGSLSERIMGRYGDTPTGMVESVLEFARICRDEGFNAIVLSIKSSNSRIMVQTNRLLVHRMMEEGMDYPIHLGVTEAGEGEDGRIKSAVGIGTLLEDGIGDTIRVSLTEDPEFEIPVALLLADRYKDRQPHQPITDIVSSPINPFEYKRRETIAAGNTGGKNIPRVILSDEDDIPQILEVNEYISSEKPIPDVHFIHARLQQLYSGIIQKLKKDQTAVLVLETANKHGMAEQRRAFHELINQQCLTPVIIKRTYKGIDKHSLLLNSSTDLGALLVDGLGDGIWVESDENIQKSFISSLSFGILQASRMLFSKTEFIACPSCGRTQFNIQKTLKEISEQTGHLKNLTIAVMGCIVNGPGEMADADYGYVGSGPGRITLYKAKEVVRRNIDEMEAVKALVDLIKLNGDWTD